MGPNSDPAALSMLWRAALGALVPRTSMRPFISLPCSREQDRVVKLFVDASASLDAGVLFPGQ
jgi:hypothetical protein